MDENKFWLRVWATIATALICIVTIVCIRGYSQELLIKEMVLAGADPISAKCSLSTYNENVVCVAHIISKK